MSEFFHAVGQYTFLQNALLSGILASVSCGIIGTYVVVRRISYLAGAIAHTVLAGLGVANYIRIVYDIKWLLPMHGALISALIASLIVGWVSLKSKEREDTVIGAIWAIGMAVGILFIFKTPGYNQELMSYLFGNILMVRSADIWLIALLDIAIVIGGVLFLNRLRAVCFDEEFARVRGINVEFWYLFLLVMTALTVVIMVSIVGIVLVIALLTLPAAIAGRFAKNLFQMMMISVVLSMFFTTGGIALSYQPNLPPGATIILVAGSCYLLVNLFGRLVSKLRA